MKRLILILALVSLIPSVADAINLNLNYPEFGGFNLKDDQSLQAIVAFFYYLIVGISGLAAFAMLVWGGVQWLVSGAIPSQASEARDKVRNAIIGLLLVLASFLVIQVINPELTIIGIGDPDVVGTGPPAGLPNPGVYLCSEDNCSGGEMLWIDPSIGNCDEIDNFSAILDECTPDFDGVADWDEKTKAIRFYSNNPDLEYNVALFESQNQQDRAICFREPGYDRLDATQIDVSQDSGWAADPDSMYITLVTSEFPWCNTPGLTLPDRTYLAQPFSLAPAVVFLFNTEQYGARGPDSSDPRSFALPLEVWRYREGENNRIDQYGEGRDKKIKSLWISDDAVCPPPGVGPENIYGENCAVRFWDKEGTDADGDGQIDTFPATAANICFKTSQPDLRNYSFEYNPDENPQCASASNDLTDDLKGLEIISASECAVEGVVENCNP